MSMQDTPHDNLQNSTILNELKPILRRLVVLTQDYQLFVSLSKDYSGQLDPKFALVASQRLVDIGRDMHKLVEDKIPEADYFMQNTFHRSVKLFNVAVKRAIAGDFTNLDNQISQILQQGFCAVKLIRSSTTVASQQQQQLPVKQKQNLPQQRQQDKPLTRGMSKDPRMMASRSYTNIDSSQPKTREDKDMSSSRRRTPRDREEDSPNLSDTNRRPKAAKSTTTLKPVERVKELEVPEQPKEWRCHKCTVVNPRGSKCHLCGEPKPKMVPSRPKELLGDFDTEPPEIKSPRTRIPPKWVCSVCKVPNIVSLESCALCGTERCADPKSANKEWQCETCTTLNYYATTRCNMCGETRTKGSRPNQKENRPRSVSSPGSGSKISMSTSSRSGNTGTSGISDNSSTNSYLSPVMRASGGGGLPLKVVNNNTQGDTSNNQKGTVGKRKIVPIQQAMQVDTRDGYY